MFSESFQELRCVQIEKTVGNWRLEACDSEDPGQSWCVVRETQGANWSTYSTVRRSHVCRIVGSRGERREGRAGQTGTSLPCRVFVLAISSRHLPPVASF